jgi:hypothetical protein
MDLVFKNKTLAIPILWSQSWQIRWRSLYLVLIRCLDSLNRRETRRAQIAVLIRYSLSPIP